MVGPVVVPVVSVVAARLVDVVAPVVPQVRTRVGPAAQTLSAVAAPVTTSLAPVTSARSPVLTPVTDSLASSLTTDGLPVAVQGPVDAVVYSACGTGTGTLVGPLPASLAPLPHTSPAGRGTTLGDPVVGDVVGPAPITGTAPDPVVAPIDGPPADGGGTPVRPAGAPCSGVVTSSTPGVGQLLGAAADPGALPLRTVAPLTWSRDNTLVLVLASEPGFSPA